MILARNLALFLALLGTFAISACSDMTGDNVQQAHSCTPLQANCSPD